MLLTKMTTYTYNHRDVSSRPLWLASLFETEEGTGGR